MMKARKCVIGVLLLAMCSAMPFTAYGENAPEPVSGPGSRNTHDTRAPETAAGGGHVGIIAVTVTVLGLLALAASSGSGNSTPASTNH